MAATPKRVSAFFLDLTKSKPDSLWTFKAGPKTAPTAYSVPTDLSMDQFYALFEEITTKIVQARKAGATSISVKVDGNDHIVRDTGFPLPSEALAHLAAAAKAINAVRRSIKG
jgi:hypothetical protein